MHWYEQCETHMISHTYKWIPTLKQILFIAALRYAALYYAMLQLLQLLRKSTEESTWSILVKDFKRDQYDSCSSTIHDSFYSNQEFIEAHLTW